MKVVRSMLGSKKWTAAIATIIGLIASDALGAELSPETLTAVVALVATIIGAEGVADAAGARASRRQHQKIAAEEVEFLREDR